MIQKYSAKSKKIDLVVVQAGVNLFEDNSPRANSLSDQPRRHSACMVIGTEVLKYVVTTKSA